MARTGEGPVARTVSSKPALTAFIDDAGVGGRSAGKEHRAASGSNDPVRTRFIDTPERKAMKTM